MSLLASSSAPTPLYATYQAQWGFSPVTITVIFGVYAVAVLASLLVFGSLSDHVGRRPMLLGALVVQAGVMVLFATASGLPVLLAARVAQGLATGAAAGAVGAGLVDLHAGRGPVANAAGAMAGTASGALGSALLVQLLPAPTELVYFVLVGIFLIQAAAVVVIAETSPRVPGARHALQPTLALPRQVRGAVAIAAPSLVAVWALAGFYGSLGPSLAGLVGNSHSTILGGASLFVLAGSGSLTVLAFHRLDPRTFALAGTRPGDRRRPDRPLVGLRSAASSASSPAPPSPERASAAASRAACGRSCRSPDRRSAPGSSPSPMSSATWRWACRRSSPASSSSTAP